jgi:hypothetical protein
LQSSPWNSSGKREDLPPQRQMRGMSNSRKQQAMASRRSMEED